MRLPLAKHGRGDRQHRVDERQLQLLVPFAAFGSEGEAGEDPLALDKSGLQRRGIGVVGLTWAGSVRSRTGRCVVRTRPVRLLVWHVSGTRPFNRKKPQQIRACSGGRYWDRTSDPCRVNAFGQVSARLDAA